MYRNHTRVVKIGDKEIGGGNPILIQSMTNTRTEDVEATVAQIQRLTKAGCEIVRCTVPTMEAAEALREIKKQIFILTIVWRLLPWSAEQIRFVSIQAISEA